MRPHAFRELSAEAFVHATESETRVERALLLAAPGARVERKAIGGHFGQALVRLSARTKDPAGIEAAVDALRHAVGGEVARTAARRLSGDLILHLRLDKQAAAGGALRLTDSAVGDVIAVRLRLRGARLSQETAIPLIQRAFGAPREAAEEE